MRHLTASQKIALLERRVANMEKQAIFGLFKSKEEKERARDIKNLQREVSRADKMSLKRIKALQTAIEDLWIDADYVKEHKGAIQSMIRDIERTLKSKERELKRKEREPFIKRLQNKIDDAKNLDEYYRIKQEAKKQGFLSELSLWGREEELFLRYLLEPYDKNIKLDVEKNGKGEFEGYVTIKGYKYRITFGFIHGNRSGNFLVEINKRQIFYNLLQYPLPPRQMSLTKWTMGKIL